MIAGRSKRSWSTRFTTPPMAMHLRRPTAIAPAPATITATAATATAVNEGAKVLLLSDSIPKWKRNGRKTVAVGLQEKRRKKRNLVCFLQSLVVEERSIVETVIIIKEVFHVHCHLIPQFVNFDRTLTIPGPGFRFSRSVQFTAWRILNLRTPDEPFIHRSCSATSCTHTWPRCNKCIHRWYLPLQRPRNTNEPESNKRRSIYSIRGIRR